MNNFKEHNVVMIATNVSAPSYTKGFLVKSIKEWTPIGENKINLNKLSISVNHSAGVLEYYEPQHLYITSDDEIKEGDWCYDDVEKRVILNQYKTQVSKKRFKIIATTDSSLTEYTDREVNGFSGDVSLPQIPQSFIEHYIAEYNKGNIITKVMIEYELYYSDEFGNQDLDLYKLKINPDNTINIKPIKNSYSREETVIKCLKMQHDYVKYKESCHFGPNLKEIAEWTDNWLEQNLN